MVIDIVEYGWSDAWSAKAGAGAQGLVPYRVASILRGSCGLVGESGFMGGVYSGTFRNPLDDGADMPAVGDWVMGEPPKGTGDPVVVKAILGRVNAFSRKPPISGGRRMMDGFITGGSTREQVVAANVDTMFMVTGLDDNFNIHRIERYLTMARAKRIKPVVLLNKSDMCPQPLLNERVAQTIGVSQDAPIRAISALSGGGMAEVIGEFLGPGLTGVLVGSSGVGKSTILNALFGHSRQRTSAVSDNNGKGRHTTTHRELFLLPGGGLMIDTPGLRELQLWATEEDLNATFPDVIRELGLCRFADCGHGTEPGCHVREALASGGLDPARYRGYMSMLGEVQRLAARKAEAKAKSSGRPASRRR